MMTGDPHDYESESRIKPDPEDYEAIEREYGSLPRDATHRETAERYQIAQSHKLIRVYGR
jgi:hypothetical protein